MEQSSNSGTLQDSQLEIITNQIDEGLAVRFTEEEVYEAGKDFLQSLVIRLVGNRGYNKAALKSVLKELWKPKYGLKFTEVEGNILIAKFADESDLENVLAKRPWRFMGWVVEIERWKSGKQLSELFSNRIQLWIQIHNLPVEF